MTNTNDKELVGEEPYIEYDLITIADLDEINELLVSEFFSNEPLGKHLGANSETDVRPWISKVTEPLINQRVSTILHTLRPCIHPYINQFRSCRKNLKINVLPKFRYLGRRCKNGVMAILKLLVL